MANRTKEINTITTKELRNLFAGGRIASVAFTKKSDGSTRILNGKLSVKRGLKGGEAPYNAEDYGQLRVFDLNVKDNNGVREGGFRSVTASNVQWVTSRGVKYVVKQPDITLNFVQKITYNVKSKTLTLQLNGKTYEYYNVSVHVHRGLVDSVSKGQYFNAQIKGKYS